MAGPADAPLTIRAGGVELAGERSGGAPAVLLLHGLTATRRYVVMGSRTLQRAGLDVIAYDARGHGVSSPAPERAYGYEHLAADAVAVLDACGADTALLAGASMGAHTAVRVALEHPERVSALLLITPAFDPVTHGGVKELARWDALAAGLREGGVGGFLAAYDLDSLPPAWRGTTETVLRQRMAAHQHPLAVADAIEVVPRSRPFEDFAELSSIDVPAVVVGSRDEADPTHPLEVAARYADAIPGARLLVEDAGPPPQSPIAWRGGALSKEIAALAALAER